ncbi:MAG: helix-turn-helix transcriptional regulator [Hespellia sp.]|nr:helix-turn-helix transcriptional regulator [Hespellia sp.]
MNIGNRISSARKAAGLSQVELANALNTTKQTIYKYENGIITNIPSDKIEQIANALSVTPSYLMGWSDIDTMDLRQFDKQLDQYVHGLGEFLYYNPSHKFLFDSSMNISTDDVELAKSVLDKISGCTSAPADNVIELQSHLDANAAHALPNASDEDKIHDDDIMNDDCF